MRARGGGAIPRGEVCPLSVFCSLPGNVCPSSIILTEVFLGLLQGTVVASDSSYRTASAWDDQRGSSLGWVGLDLVQGVMMTLDLAEETPIEPFVSLFFFCIV